MNWKYAGRIYEEDWWSQAFLSWSYWKFLVWTMDLPYSTQMDFTWRIRIHWHFVILTGLIWLDGSILILSIKLYLPKRRAKVSGTRKLDWKKSSDQNDSSKTQSRSPIISGLQVPIQRRWLPSRQVVPVKTLWQNFHPGRCFLKPSSKVPLKKKGISKYLLYGRARDFQPSEKA